MLDHIRRHVDGVAGAHRLLLDLAGFGFPLNHAVAAQDKINLLEIRRVFDLDALMHVLVVLVPVVRTVAGRNFIDIEKEVFRGNDTPDLPGFPGQAADVLRRNRIRFYDF